MLPVAALTFVAFAVGLNAVAAAKERARQRAVAERLDVRVSAGGAEAAYGAAGLLALTFTVQNRGGPISFGQPSLEPPVYPVLTSAPPNPIGMGAERVFALRLRLTCDDLSAPRSGTLLRMRLPVTGPNGRTQVLESPLDPAFVAEAAQNSCGLVELTQAARLAVRAVRAAPESVAFDLTVTNRSQREFEVVRLTAPGLRLTTDGRLPLLVAAGRSVAARVTMSVESCALVARAGIAQQAGARDLEPAEFEVDLVGSEGSRETVRFRNRPGEQLHTAWLSHIARACGTL